MIVAAHELYDEEDPDIFDVLDYLQREPAMLRALQEFIDVAAQVTITLLYF